MDVELWVIFFNTQECPAKGKQCTFCKRTNHFESVCLCKCKSNTKKECIRYRGIFVNKLGDIIVNIDNHPIDSGAK
jgi:hypothetical protein